MSDRDGKFEIYLMNPDGSNQTNVSNDPAWDYHPAWSRDGMRLAFYRERDDPAETEILVVSLYGPDGCCTKPRYVVDGQEPTWSPDDRYLAFVSSPSNGPTTSILILPTGNLQAVPFLVTDQVDSLQPFRRLTWSPDSAQIAFTSPHRIDHTWVEQIWIVDSDGSDLRKLTPDTSGAVYLSRETHECIPKP